MELNKKNRKAGWIKWVGILMLLIYSGLYSCGSSQPEQSQDSNLGEEQTNFEVDTTATGGRGGTGNSLGRADADTSGTGRQMTNDTAKQKQ